MLIGGMNFLFETAHRAVSNKKFIPRLSNALALAIQLAELAVQVIDTGIALAGGGAGGINIEFHGPGAVAENSFDLFALEAKAIEGGEAGVPVMGATLANIGAVVGKALQVVLDFGTGIAPAMVSEFGRSLLAC